MPIREGKLEKEMDFNDPQEVKDLQKEEDFDLSEMSVKTDKTQSKKDWKEIVQELIADENEAIQGYDDAIEFIANADIDESKRNEIIKGLNEIKDDEIDHIQHLKELSKE